MSTHTISYDDIELAIVEIDPEVAAPAIKEMVEFWACWERRLWRAKGGYTEVWLKQLAEYLLNHGKSPVDDEGWYPLDGSKGIKLRSFTPYTPDTDLITIANSD